MTKRIAILMVALVLVLISTAACTANEGRVEPQSSSQTNASMSSYEDRKETESSNKTDEPEMNQKQIERETQKMKENGIVDENGKPAPGVDLNDYPGLG